MIHPRRVWEYRSLIWRYHGLLRYFGFWPRNKDLAAGAITCAAIGFAAALRR